MKKLVVLFVLLGVASGAWASNDWLQTNATSTDWFAPTNWSGGVVPSLAVSTNTRMYQTHMAAAKPIILSGQNAESWQLDIGGDNDVVSPTKSIMTVTLNEGATLTIGDYFRMGSSSTSNRWGAFYMNGGTVNVGGYMCVGYGATTTDVRGWLYMTGGTINVGEFRFANASGASGIAEISGGTINVSGILNMRPAGTSGSATTKLDVSGTGKVVLAGNQEARVQGYIDNGWIYSGGVLQTGYEIVSYDAGTDKTTIAVPEPITMLLLGLGGLLIRRK